MMTANKNLGITCEFNVHYESYGVLVNYLLRLSVEGALVVAPYVGRGVREELILRQGIL